MNRSLLRTIKTSLKSFATMVLTVGVTAWGLAAMLALTPTEGVAQAATREDYVLGAGDTVRITVYQSPDLSLETRISESGTVSYPLLGQVRLGNLSVAQAERTVADGLRKGNFLKTPQVSILVTQVRGNQANALGMVGKPGRYPIEVAGMRMSELLATAGGISAGGSDIVTLTGVRNGQPIRRQIDLPALLTAGSVNDDPVILNGDTIFVDRMPQIYIYGEVGRPGTVRLERNMTVMQALATAGGLTARGTDKGIKIHRTSGGGRVEILEPALNDMVKESDVVYIRQSLF